MKYYTWRNLHSQTTSIYEVKPAFESDKIYLRRIGWTDKFGGLFVCHLPKQSGFVLGSRDSIFIKNLKPIKI